MENIINSIVEKHPILLFDGVCNLCNGAVQFIIARDKNDIFRFASLQSEIGQQLLQKYQVQSEPLSTVVLIDEGHVYTHLEVTLRIVHHFGGIWLLLKILYLLPRSFRDRLYHFIARNRYRWFGKKETCWLPRPELKTKFLDNL